MNECELLNIAFDTVRQFQKYAKGVKFQLLLTSSEIVDAIMDECRVPLHLRHAVIQGITLGKDTTLVLKNIS